MSAETTPDRAPRARRAYRLIAETLRAWYDHDSPRVGAALAYYTAFSLAPILVIAISVAGLVFGQDAAREQMSRQLSDLLGATGAAAVDELLSNAHTRDGDVIATVLGVITLIIGASTLFAELQSALNRMWDAPKPTRSGVLTLLRARFLSFAMVLVIGFLLLVSLVISAVLAGVQLRLGGVVPIPVVAQGINLVASIAVSSLLFGLLFIVLPDVHVSWRDTYVGALVTGVLFSLGKLLIGLYLGRSALASTYGAAGSFVVMLVWVYYSAQLILLGAEFTRVYARRLGVEARQDQPASL